MNYIKIKSGTGETSPKNILLFPLVMNNVAKGILEIGTLKEFSDLHIDFLEQVSESISISLNTVMVHNRMAVLLD